MKKNYDLTAGDIRTHIRRMAIPAAIGLFCQTLYNLTDTFYAGFIGTEAQAALAFSFPLYFIILSCCVGLGQSVTSHAANALGAKRLARAVYFIGQGTVLATVLSLLIYLLLPLTETLATALGARGQTKIWTVQYSSILFGGAPLFLFIFLCNSALQAAGNATAYRNSVILAVIANIFLDPLLMFGYFGLPALGVAGIGWATLIAQLIGIIYLLPILAKTVFADRWRSVFLRPRRHILATLGKQMLAPTGRMLATGASFFIITGFLGRLDGDAVAAYGIALRIEQLFLLPTIGLEFALVSIAGQNLGANKVDRTRLAYYLCLRYGIYFMLAAAVVLIFAGRYFIAFFNDHDAVIRYGEHYLWLAACIGSFYVILNAAGAVMLGGLQTRDIAVSSVVRLIILPPLLFWLLAIAGGLGVSGIWLGIFLSNVVVTLWMHKRCLRLLKNRLVAGRG